MAAALVQLKLIDLNKPASGYLNYYRANIKTAEDLEYGFKLQALLSKLKDMHLRVESPWISIYTNSKHDIDLLAKLDETRVKYVCVPPENGSIAVGEIVLPKINFEYKVTMSKTNKENTAFVEWAKGNSKVKITERCARELSQDTSWGGSYFYITGEKNLLVAKMHLGGSINKIERIVKS